MSDVVERLLAAKEFLRGAAPWDGIWFNEAKVDAINRVHRWWWRKDCLPVIDEAAAEILSHRTRWSRLCALVMTDHRGDGLPTQEVTPDEMVAAVERVFARDATLTASLDASDAVVGEVATLSNPDLKDWRDDWNAEKLLLDIHAVTGKVIVPVLRRESGALDAAYARGVAAERERCARVADAMAENYMAHETEGDVAERIAAAIRKGG